LVGAVALIALLAVAGYLAFGGDEEPGRRLRQEPVVSEEQAVTIDVVDNDYEPRDLTIRPGTEVTWKFKGDLPHTVTDPDGRFDSGTLGPGSEFVMTFADPGEYFYYCVLHHAMQGTVTVAP
jgi:plastocyanin